MVYGYVRVSSKKQKEDRQIKNIKEMYSDAIIYVDKFTGTKMSRPSWNRLMQIIMPHDYIIFDEISRMSRCAEEGFTVYKELYEKEVNLVFIKESTLNTDNFRTTTQIALTGEEIADMFIETTNRVLMLLAEKQIYSAFESAQHEVEFLHKRTSEGVRQAIAQGKNVGIEKGRKLHTKKEKEMLPLLEKYSKSFSGTLNDIEVMKLLGLSRNTYYKYKKLLLNM